MKLTVTKLRLHNFRNFEKAEFSFSPEQNWIIGENGSGKTSILEALFLISTGRSHRTQNLLEAVRYGTSHFTIEAFFSSYDIEERIYIAFGPSIKEVWHNQTKLQSFTALLGILPSLLYAPSDIALIERSPKERRRFLNLHLAQLDSAYLCQLGHYTKALSQRNALLRSKKTDPLLPWETLLASKAKELLIKRKQFLEKISDLLSQEYKYLQKRDEIPYIAYHPSPSSPPTQALWEKMRPKEYLLGYTLLGPHRDNFELFLNKKPAKTYASEGQKRSLIAAIKIAEASLFSSLLFLVDDFGVHLDTVRQSLLYERIETFGQLFLTAPLIPFSSCNASVISCDRY